MMHAQNKHTIVVGGTRGIGRCFAHLVSSEKERVSVIGSSPPGGGEHNVLYARYSCDITDRNALYAMLDSLPPWTSLVLFQRYRGAAPDMPHEWAVSVQATVDIIDFLVEKAVGSATFVERGIVFVGSLAARLDCAEQSIAYHACKAALEQMMRSYAVRLGPQGIRVNMVTPAVVLKEQSTAFYAGHEKLQSLYKEIIPLQRMGTSEEVARVIRFLCSDEASYITGHNLVIDGGLSLQMQEGLARRAARHATGDEYA